MFSSVVLRLGRRSSLSRSFVKSSKSVKYTHNLRNNFSSKTLSQQNVTSSGFFGWQIGTIGLVTGGFLLSSTLFNQNDQAFAQEHVQLEVIDVPQEHVQPEETEPIQQENAQPEETVENTHQAQAPKETGHAQQKNLKEAEIAHAKKPPQPQETEHAQPVQAKTISFDSYMLPESELPEGGLRILEVDNPIVIPVRTPVKFMVTATDVLHAFSVPAFGIKVDAVPGRINQLSVLVDHEGTFYGQCSELCGVNHGFMPIVVHVVSVPEYQRWVQSKLAKKP